MKTMRRQVDFLILSFLIIIPSLSYAYDHEYHSQDHPHGHDRDWHGHARSYVGVNFSVWPDNYYDEVPYYGPPDEVLVSAPVYIQEPETIIPSSTPGVELVDSITVNIPNYRGSYTPVTLKRSGSGFIGPQGEFYTEFPKVSQLIVMYGK